MKRKFKDEDVDFFTTKNVGADSLVDLVNHDGDVIIIPMVIPTVSRLKKNSRFFLS
jgi:hypothetical protein